MKDIDPQDEIQLVIFELGEEEFGVDISQVKEIIRMQEITKIPNSPPFIKGVINLRGSITPVMDLRSRLGVQAKDETDNLRIVIVEIEKSSLGVIVDSVDEVMRLSGKNIDPAPSVTTTVETKYIWGVGKLKDRLLIMLDLNKVLSERELESLKVAV